ncbi:cadherin-87A [Aricia agestis]|uniref:cadherin-87A n=1 Tax=Aricia agestis TaxID=91739 RepID=UPI001C201BCB|nr:cadherin-87A [Aricia agestis]XP_041988773.1 cadherin-87A [Aricia agestis]
MATRRSIVVIWTTLCCLCAANQLPVFTQDMDNLPLSESTPLGTVVYTLQGTTDPEGLPIKYGLVGTDKFFVNPETGEVTLQQSLDREREDTIKFLVSIENEDPETKQALVTTQPVSVIVLDENDNPPMFKNTPYEVDVSEDEKIGTTILNNIEVEDQDSVGDSLDVGCIPNSQWPETCNLFEVVTLQSTANHFTGALVLRGHLDYNDKQFYQIHIYATDGSQNSTSVIEVKVLDVQNSPPVFSGSLSTSLAEDVPAGTLALKITARDPDRAQPRDVHLELITNPHNFFWLDSATGDLKTAKPLDREALEDPSSPLNLTIRASEIVNGAPLISNLTSTVATVTVTIKDVNDEPPRFNKREYSVELPENLPIGTPLPNLDMVVTDTDVGMNSVFTLRVSESGWTVEPAEANGKATVTLRLNSSLDYEDPNQRRFIIEVIAEELHTSPRLSSRASVLVTLVDANDNAPEFSDEAYPVSLPEAAAPGTRVTALRASDKDTGRFGTEGIVYTLSGSGAELFNVDNRSGVITVAECPTPGKSPCLDYETRKDYFLQYKATDDDGQGQMSVVSLQVSLTDSNDNPPVFVTPVYKASIDEDAIKFEPELQVQARDADATSDIRYTLLGPPSPFWVEEASGRVVVRHPQLLTELGGHAVLTVMATDGVHNTTCLVEITVRDVNNHAPVFDTDKYNANITEDAPIGTEVAAVHATDLDSGINSEFSYAIQKGALESFVVDNSTGVVTVAAHLDYDRRNTYRIQIVATDMGIPTLTGTTELTVHVINVNDKRPYFTPVIQRAEVSADAEPGTVLHTLVAIDPDITDHELLMYELATDRAIRAVDKHGKEVAGDGISWFHVLSNGTVEVAQKLDRERAAVVTLPVAVTDTSAPTLQRADGELIINIVDVNRNAPVFGQPAYLTVVAEETPVGSVLGTYTATDRESPIAAITIDPPSPYFEIDNVTGVVKIAQRIDYESIHAINFTLVAYDSGVPQRRATAAVLVDVTNVNDETPHFQLPQYEAELPEHSPPGTVVVAVHADDDDEGEYGQVKYSLSGDQASLFVVDADSGVVTVAEGTDIDRETTTDVWFRVVATDHAPPQLAKSASVPVHVKIKDINDNPPSFRQDVFKSTITENVKLDPPATILQVLAEDRDEGVNAQIQYKIVEQTEPGVFTVDPTSGIIYPARAVRGGATYSLTVEARDGGGLSDRARVDVAVLSVNKRSPQFVQPPLDKRIDVPEHSAQPDYLVTTILATDEDEGENGRVSYYLKVDNQNVGETKDFRLDPQTGELRIKAFLDREQQAEYQLVVAAEDNGTPAKFESVRLLTVALVDDQDTAPRFPVREHQFSVSENLPPGIIIGTVKAIDRDSGENGKVYYHVLEGNQEGAFTVDRTQGIIRANITFDREKQDEYILTIYASNSPLLENASTLLNAIDNGSDSAVATVTVRVLDENDNEPVFPKKVYYAGVKHTARVNEPIITIMAEDPDLDENGTLIYMIAASNLYKFGDSKSSGSIVPSPFNISQDGVVSSATPLAEYARDRFALEIRVHEQAPPHRSATAMLYLWIVEHASLIRMVVSRSCAAGASETNSRQKFGDAGASETDIIRRRLGDAAGALLVPARTLPLVHHDTRYDDWCEIHMHAVDPVTYQVLSVDKVLQTIDSKYDDLKDVYQQYGVETLIAASTSSKAADSFDPALAALIALLIVLFTGIVTFVVVCACLKHWVIPPPSLQSSKGDSLARRRILEELSTTENPLWLETKLRPYEEQELTMNVFGDQNEQNSDQPQLVPDNTYATIAGRGTEYGSLREREPSALEAALGFQGSTFKPPTPDTPEPPPRPSAGLGPL